MDPKELKAVLKEAFLAVKNKEYKTALKHCKTILKSDKNNYTGLVLFGAALQESEQREQAPKAYLKAIEVCPDQLLAWQGLASFYEKYGSETNQKELLQVYHRLMALESDMDKFTDCCTKMASLAVKLNSSEAFDMMRTTSEVESLEKQKILSKVLVSAIAPMEDLSEPLSEMLLTALTNVVASNSSNDTQDYYQLYLQLLYRHNRQATLLAEARRIHRLLPDITYPLEKICQVYSEQVVVNGSSDLGDDMAEEYYDALRQAVPESVVAFTAMGASLFRRGDYISSREVLKQVVEVSPEMWAPWVLLARTHMCLHCYLEVEHSATRALSLLEHQGEERPGLQQELGTMLARALCLQDSSEKWQRAVEQCQRVLASDKENTDTLLCMARANIHLGVVHEAESYLHKIEQEEKHRAAIALLRALILVHQSKTEDAIGFLEKEAAAVSWNAELWFELGQLCWKQEQWDKSSAALQKAVELDPLNYRSHVYLGNMYVRGGDLSAAKNSYRKALSLNVRCAEAGMGLSDIFRQQRNLRSNEVLLTKMLEMGAGKWAWLRLGLHHMDQGSVLDAIACLRSAVRCDPSDSHCWESLADAYKAQGAYSTAMKSYQRVAELAPHAVYPVFQIATMKQTVGLYKESAELFRQLLAEHPHYVPAMKGLGETCLYLARSYRARQLLGRSRDLCLEALQHLTSALETRADLCCLWKLCADVGSLLASLPESLSRPEMPKWLTNEVSGRGSALELARHCYCRALQLAPESSFLWHDLATNYSCQADTTSSSKLRRQLREHALAAVKKALSLNARSWQHWNLMGIVAATKELKNYPLAQHAFIRSIQTESNNPVAWTNLGTLYMCLRDLKLANKAFREAQSIDPTYIECWIGQALLAEQVGSREAMDLFRHTTELGVHPESCRGYAHWVCSTLLGSEDHSSQYYVYSIVKNHAVPLACDAMTWYTAVSPEDACAHNVLGLLLERQSLHGSAAKAFEKSLPRAGEHSDKVHINLGRVLAQRSRYEEAIAHYKQVRESSFVSQCGLAIAYYQAGHYEDSYAAYETALEWLAPSDTSKSHVLTAMAPMLYLAGKVDDAKTLLFQCVQLKPPSVQGLFALCALGMLESDLRVSELTLRELVGHRDDPEYLTHIAVFEAYAHVLQGRQKNALSSLSAVVHRHPAQISLWLSLALLLLHLSKPQAAGRCANITTSRGRAQMDVSKIMSLESLSHLLLGHAMPSLRSSQKAVHAFPHIPENWVVLIASFLPWCMHHQLEKHTVWLKEVISLVRRKLEASKQMGRWLSNYERKAGILIEEYRDKAKAK